MRKEWTTVYAPFIPELEFGGELPTTDQWDVAVLPDDSEEPLHLYDVETGETRPIGSDASGEPDVTENEDVTDDLTGMTSRT